MCYCVTSPYYLFHYTRDEPLLVGMNCLLYISDNNLLVGCQSGHLASVDLSTMQVTSQVCLPPPLSYTYPLLLS